MAHTHDAHDSHASAEAAGAASWMVAMVAFLVLAAALVIALFVWAPWDDDNTSSVPGGGNVPGVNEGTDNNSEGGVDISGNDINVDPNGGEQSGQ